MRVIASSPTDVQRVLDAIVEAANRLCGGHGAAIMRLRKRDRRLAACALVGDAAESIPSKYGPNYFEAVPGDALSRASISGRAFLDQRTVVIEDLAEAVRDEYPGDRRTQSRFGTRSVAVVPLLHQGEPIGVLPLGRIPDPNRSPGGRSRCSRRSRTRR